MAEQQYTIVHGGVGAFAQGAIVTAADLGVEGKGLERLLTLGAIEEAAATPVVATNPGQIPPATLTTGQPGGPVGGEAALAALTQALGAEAANALAAAGYGTVALIAAASDEDLLKVAGIGAARIKLLRDLKA